MVTGGTPWGTPSLAGVRVLDLTRNLAGPYCTMTLGDLGADVVKVEHPITGDDTRAWTPPAWNGQSTTFLTANRNKRSLAVDLDQPEGVDIVRALARRADVLVESFRPGSLAKRGLDYESLQPDNDGLIYCTISAYGGVGPRRDHPGYDPVLQAFTGIMHMTGEPDGPPTRLGIGAIDLGAGLWTTIAVLTALAAKREHGRGCRIETSLYEVAVWWLSYHLVGYLGSGVDPMRQGTATTMIAPYEAFETADGNLLVCAANDNLYAALCDVLDVRELAHDPRFVTNPDRVAHRDVLRAELAPRFLLRTAAEWERRLEARSVPCSRMRTVADTVADEQLAALGLLVPVPHPDVPDLRVIDMPVRRDGRRAERLDAPPRLGQHSAEVLAELGYSAADIAALTARGVVAADEPD